MTRLLAILFLTAPAFAGDKIEIPEQPKPVAVANASSNAVSASESNSYSNSASSSNSNSGGNQLSVNTNVPRQVGAVAQGSIIPPGCGAGGNAGGAGPNGTGFLGFSFVTSECHGWTYIATLSALGLQKDACEALKRQNTSRRAKRRGAPEVDCSTLPGTAVPTQSASTAPRESVERCVTGEHLDRVVKACAGSK